MATIHFADAVKAAHLAPINVAIGGPILISSFTITVP